MKAYVINDNQLKRIIVSALVVAVIFFLAGYFIGQSQSPEIKLASRVDVPVEKNLDADAATVANLEKSQSKVVSEKVKQKTKIKSDKKQSNQAKKKPAVKKVAAKKQPQKKQPQKKQVENKKSVNNKSSDNKKNEKKTSKPAKPKTATIKSQKATVEKPVDKNNQSTAELSNKVDSTSKTSDENSTANTVTSLDERMYSIQAGMFASKNNAQSFIKKLAEKDFEAYVSDFISSSGTVKYNVRIGNFSKRDNARELLKKFQSVFSSPAYVVITQ